MKRTILALALSVVVAPVAFAEPDAGEAASNTTDTSTNILTGTKKKVVTKKQMVKRGGAKAKVETKETTKEHKNGKVEKEVEVEGKEANHE